jgi:endonuclease-8
LPEGDTIHRWARRLDAALTGHTVVRFELRRDPRGNRLPAKGTAITRVEARGKHLLVQFDDGATLHTHMELHGRWDVYRRGERWRRPAHTARVVIEVEDGTSAVCFAAPIVELRREGKAGPPTRASRSLAALGPDLCDDAPDLDEVMRRVDATDASRPIGDLLLDQRVAAGIGNVYKSEVCWAHRVHPFTPLRDVDADLRRALYETAHTMLHANLTTPRRVTYRDGLAVYANAGRPCPRCRTPIAQAYGGDDEHADRVAPLPVARPREQASAALRTTFWCPTCQPPPP